MLLYPFLDKEVQKSKNKALAWIQRACECQREHEGFLVLSQWLSCCSSLLDFSAQSLRKQSSSVLFTNNPFNNQANALTFIPQTREVWFSWEDKKQWSSLA